MNNPAPNTETRHAAAAIRLIRMHLDSAVDELPHHVTERLRITRVRALSQLKQPTVRVDHTTNRLVGWLQQLPTLARTMVIAPAVFLAIFASQRSLTPEGDSQMIASMAATNTTNKGTDLPNIDAILNEEIPLQAYLDSDFNQFNQKITQQSIHGNTQKIGLSHGSTR